MGSTITISISGSGHDTDAPPVDDLFDQLRDYFDLLSVIERTIAEDGQSAIDWRIVNASKSNPITFTAEAFSRQFAVNIDQRSALVAETTAHGMKHLLDGNRSDRPRFFTDPALQKSQKIFERVTNGLESMTIVVDERVPAIDLTPGVARESARRVRDILTPTFRPYKEIGSVEGYFQSVSLDGRGRRVLHMKSRLTGDDVKCIVAGDAQKELEHCDIGDVWSKRRISVIGLVHYKAPLRISQIDATEIKFFKSKSELPSIDDIVDPDFTNGLRSEEYLEKLRNGKSS